MSEIKRIVIIIAASLVFFFAGSIRSAAGDGMPKDTIDCIDDLYEWIDYLCLNGEYGHDNDMANITSLDCMGVVSLLYSKMGVSINYSEILNESERITNLSSAELGDIVVYVNPDDSSKYYGEISHVAILLEDGELFQATSKIDNMVTMTRQNKRSWSNVCDFRCNWKGEYASWGWGSNDESEHPDNIFIIHIDKSIDMQRKLELILSTIRGKHGTAR